MGNPTGEKIKSEASEQMITSRAENAFQVKYIFIALSLIETIILENGSGPGWRDIFG